MYTRWTAHLSDKSEKEEFQNYIRSSKTLLNRLRDILAEEDQRLSRSELSEKQYDTVNWTYLQAHKNGFRQALSLIKQLVDLDQQEHNIDRITAGQQQPE